MFMKINSDLLPFKVRNSQNISTIDMYSCNYINGQLNKKLNSLQPGESMAFEFKGVAFIDTERGEGFVFNLPGLGITLPPDMPPSEVNKLKVSVPSNFYIYTSSGRTFKSSSLITDTFVSGTSGAGYKVTIKTDGTSWGTQFSYIFLSATIRISYTS